jgi:hypothetical protein
MFSNEIFKQLSSIFENHAIKEIKQHSNGSETLEIRNPANILNSWVIADQFNEIASSKNPRLYSPMYSLIDRKKIKRYTTTKVQQTWTLKKLSILLIQWAFTAKKYFAI